MVPKNDYFLRFNRSTASFLAVMNGYGGKPFELHFMLLKNFDRTNLLQFSTQINLSAPILHRIVCSVDTDKTFRFETHCGYRVGSFGRNKKPMIGVGWESAVGDNARGKTNRVAFVAVCVFFAPNSFVWSLGPMLWERRKESKYRQ